MSLSPPNSHRTLIAASAKCRRWWRPALAYHPSLPLRVLIAWLIKFAGLVEMIKEAFAIRNQLLSGSHDSIEAMSGRLGMNKGRLTSLVRLSYLGPEIVRALLAGSQSNALTPSRLLRLSKNLPHDWKEQRCFLGFAA